MGISGSVERLNTAWGHKKNKAFINQPAQLELREDQGTNSQSLLLQRKVVDEFYSSQYGSGVRQDVLHRLTALKG